jgi:hypothetical protein
VPHRLPHMDKFDRVYQLHGILAGRKTPISLNDLMGKVEGAKATVFRRNRAADFVGKWTAVKRPTTLANGSLGEQARSLRLA